MKPNKKNRVMCPDCGRQKMLFNTERKANDFIRWNGEDMAFGGDRLRAYDCPSCCGWHITHRSHKADYDNRTDNLINAFERANRKKEKIDRLINHQNWYERHRQLVEEHAREIFCDAPEDVRNATSKADVKHYLNDLFAMRGIDDSCGELRTEVYRIWERNKENNNVKRQTA